MTKGLEEDYKEIFLDIACILKSWKKEKAVRALESCRFHARNGLRVLEQKSLMTISKFGYLDMHDNLEEMGKNIVRRLHPDDPNKRMVNHCRIAKQVWMCIVLTENGILMKLAGTPNALQYVDWLVLTKLAILDLHHSRLRTLDLGLTPNCESLFLKRCYDLVEVSIRVECLKLVSLDLNGTKLRTLDLSLTPNLEDCNELAEIHMPAASLKLKQVNLHNSKLRSLKRWQVPNIEKLSLQNCFDLRELHMPEGCPKLRFHYLSGSKLRTLDTGLTPDLKRLYLKGCSSLVELLDPSGCRKTLVYLDLSGCWRFKSFLFDKSRKPKFDSLPELDLIAESIDVCQLHRDNYLPKFRLRCVYIEYIPLGTGNLREDGIITPKWRYDLAGMSSTALCMLSPFPSSWRWVKC
ncbi:disease resistance protein (TIR-NBS-LRR class) [Artemisia annua]|uniref:Disease resistance protein (TIR-NBS-LRR class) n=1 Tax=Artemisia annua TaxID=35608 RepID=A0A2U1NIV9_ARTAN|nr:disease resistance protein (TIR-NBS-LRR class) [Artemisia annua]